MQPVGEVKVSQRSNCEKAAEWQPPVRVSLPLPSHNNRPCFNNMYSIIYVTYCAFALRLQHIYGRHSAVALILQHTLAACSACRRALCRGQALVCSTMDFNRVIMHVRRPGQRATWQHINVLSVTRVCASQRVKLSNQVLPPKGL